jgi:uncharacterized protein (TIGR02300 family)
MAPAALGLKRRCLSCGAAFFDLKRDPIVCPGCKAEFTPPPPLPRRPAFKSRIPDPVQPVHVEEPEAGAAAEEPETESEETNVDEPAEAAEDDPHVLDPDLDDEDA